MAELVPQLDCPVYHQAIKLRGYNRMITVFQAVTSRDASKVLRRLKPEWTREDHISLSKKHDVEADTQRQEWDRLLNEAAMETFGRPFLFTDYIISAIGRGEFSEEKKVLLRFAAHAATYHQLANRAHAIAARRR